MDLWGKSVSDRGNSYSSGSQLRAILPPLPQGHLATSEDMFDRHDLGRRVASSGRV